MAQGPIQSVGMIGIWGGAPNGIRDGALVDSKETQKAHERFEYAKNLQSAGGVRILLPSPVFAPATAHLAHPAAAVTFRACGTVVDFLSSLGPPLFFRELVMC